MTLQQDVVRDTFQKLVEDLGWYPRISMPRWVYWKNGSTLFCYNTEPFTPFPQNKNRRWAAWKYRINKKKGTYRQVGRIIYFTSRKKAKARAYKWYQTRKEDQK